MSSGPSAVTGNKMENPVFLKKCYSSGQRPNGVLDNQFVGFWLIGYTPPIPPAGILPQKSTIWWIIRSTQGLWKQLFSNLGGFLEPSNTSCFFFIDFASKKNKNPGFRSPQTLPKPVPKRPKSDVSKTSQFLTFF